MRLNCSSLSFNQIIEKRHRNRRFNVKLHICYSDFAENQEFGSKIELSHKN